MNPRWIKGTILLVITLILMFLAGAKWQYQRGADAPPPVPCATPRADGMTYTAA